MLATTPFASGLLMDLAAVAAVALVAYLFCRRPRVDSAKRDAKLMDELARAGLIATQLESLAARLAAETASHATMFAGFKLQAAEMQSGRLDVDWTDLRKRADGLLGATWRLATTLSLAHDQLNNKQNQLMTFTSSRIDAATGLHNRRSMQEQLEALLAIHADGKRRFSVAGFCVAETPGESQIAAETRLQLVARLLQECIRDDDFVARYSEDEFIVLMPQTQLVGALAFADRLMRHAAAHLRCSIWGGVVEAQAGEAAAKLLSRADCALYSARAEGESCLFFHTGVAVRRHQRDQPSEPPAVRENGAAPSEFAESLEPADLVGAIAD